MPDIKITDKLGAAIQVVPATGLSIMKYFKEVPDLLMRGKSLAELSAIRLSDPAITSLDPGLTFARPVPIGTSAVELKIRANATASFGVFVPDPNLDYAHGQEDSLFGISESFDDPIPVGKDERYVSVGFSAGIGPALEAAPANLTFGFSANTEIAVTNYRKFSTVPSNPTLLEPLKETLASLQLPGDIEDLAAMPQDSVITVDGTGTLRFSGSANLLTAVNPLAAVSLPAPLPSVGVSGGGSIEVGASFEVTTGYELRIWKAGPNQVRLGYYHHRGTDVGVSASASAGIASKLGGLDLLGALMSAISPKAHADVQELLAVLPLTEANVIRDTVKAGIQRSLEIALQYEFSAFASKQAAFLYAVDLAALDAAGRRAIHNALDGDLSGLVSPEGGLPAGIVALKNIFSTLRQRKHVLRVNLLGIYNSISVSKLTSYREFLYEPQTGQLTITDAAGASRIAAAMVNIAPKQADLHKLRQVLADSFLLTTVYQAELGLVGNPPQLSATHSYFELHDRTNHETMRDELDAAVGLGLMSRDQQTAAIAGIDEFGRTLAYAEVDYDDPRTRALFLEGDDPRTVDAYESAGRAALQMIVHEGDQDAYRLQPARNDALWARMKSAGQANFGPLFPGFGGPQLGAIVADYSLIVWWADAMAAAAIKLAEMRRFLNSAGSIDVENNTFKALHADLANHLESVAANTKTDFGRPWGLIAMNLAAANQSAARVTIVGPVLALALERPAPSRTVVGSAGS